MPKAKSALPSKHLPSKGATSAATIGAVGSATEAESLMYLDWLVKSSAMATREIHTLKQAVYEKTKALDDLGSQLETLAKKASNLEALEKAIKPKIKDLVVINEMGRAVFGANPVQGIAKALQRQYGEGVATVMGELMPAQISSIDIIELPERINKAQSQIQNSLQNMTRKYLQMVVEIDSMKTEIDVLQQGVDAIESYL